MFAPGSPETSGSTSPQPYMASSHPEMLFTYPATDRQPLTESVSQVQVPASQRRRRASMQDALDPALIKAEMYQKLDVSSKTYQYIRDKSCMH